MPARNDLNSILVFGSGPIVIGQACEFDYSGNQAVRALKEEGYRVVVLNPNPATVMTTPGSADAIYLDPLQLEYVEDVIRRESPDAALVTMGGQTALNLAIDLDAAGIFERYGVEVIGANIDSIRKAEDRGAFKRLVAEIGLESPRSVLIGSAVEGARVQQRFGLPLIIRPSYTLGGRGGSIAHTPAEAEHAIRRALDESPVHTALVEESLIGWKEFELEVMRDSADNAVIVCSIENVDPMGVHTGDSITVAPIQTLSDREYQSMRSAAIEILRAVGVDCGGSNVQFAVNPADGRMVVIEMNPRVSRSSALASKATGFPIARASARLAVGYTLDEIINDITGKTVSSFEPALDYVAVKVPRFELDKFPDGYASLGTQMKSVGESLALGRSFPEALGKALRAAELGQSGLIDLDLPDDELRQMCAILHPRRIFAAYTLLVRHGAPVMQRINALSGYDLWFLHGLAEVAAVERAVRERLDDRVLAQAKRLGIADARLAHLASIPEAEVAARRRRVGLAPVYHFVDTCAGEFEADTPYFYSTYGEADEGGAIGAEGVAIVGSGPNRVGQGLEFDTCCTLSAAAFRARGVKTVMINSNPETVSTDFNVSDRLYIEPLTPEDVLGVLNKEGITRAVLQLGGQTPINMAAALTAAGIEVVGTGLEAINAAEDRGRFVAVLQRTGLRQPANRIAASHDEVAAKAREIGYPVLLRPSFVLGGRSMMVATDDTDLAAFVRSGVRVDADAPVLIDQFLEDAFEYDVDAVSDGRNVYVGGVMQHIEAAGVHSGDSACVFPAYKADAPIEQEMVAATVALARDIGVNGLINVQFAVKDGLLYVLEVNPRASRTVPFLSKVSGVDLVKAAVDVWLGRDLKAQGLVGADGVGVGRCVTGWAVKEAMFSFDRFGDHDPVLGPEMRSTGESIGIGDGFGEAFAKATAATGARLPTGGRVFVSVNDADKATIAPVVQGLERLGFHIAASRGTAAFLFERGIVAEVMLKVHEGHPHVLDHVRGGRVDLVINTPRGDRTQQDDGEIRIAAMRAKIPYTTTISAAEAALAAIEHLKSEPIRARRLPDPQPHR